MNAKKVFFRAWLWLGILSTILLVVILIAIFLASKASWYIFFVSLVPSVIVLWLRWSNRIIVPAKWNHIYEWKGKVLNSLTPGMYFPFVYLGFLNEGIEIPMENQIMHILTGVRDGLSPDIVSQYAYGAQSNAEPNTGDYLRLMYKLEYKCLDSEKLAYNQADPFSYIAGIVELQVNKYVHANKSEDIVDKFTEQNLQTLAIVPDMTSIGVELISFIPVDVLLTPEIEEVRRALDVERRKKELINTEVKNAVLREKNKKKVLDVELSNMDVRKKIAGENNKIKVEAINAIKIGVGVNGVVALKMAMKEKTLETIAKASENGSITYIDDSGSGDNTTSQAAKFGWGIKATGTTITK